jgi:hypothetical protein
MALTLSPVTRTNFGDKRVRIYDVTFDSSYPTGGESLTPADVGLKAIYTVEGSQARNADGSLTHSIIYDHANKKLLAHQFDGSALSTQAFEEVAAGTNLSAFSTRLMIVGK